MRLWSLPVTSYLQTQHNLTIKIYIDESLQEQRKNSAELGKQFQLEGSLLNKEKIHLRCFKALMISALGDLRKKTTAP